MLAVAHQLQRIFDRLRAADVEMHATLQAELLLRVDGNRLGQLDAGLMQILAGDLRQHVDLALQRVVEALVAVAEVDRRVPHLQIEERHAGGVVHPAAFAMAEDLRRIDVVNGVAKGAVLRLIGQQLRRQESRRLRRSGRKRSWEQGLVNYLRVRPWGPLFDFCVHG